MDSPTSPLQYTEKNGIMKKKEPGIPGNEKEKIFMMTYGTLPYIDKPVSRLFAGTMLGCMSQGQDASELLDQIYAMGINAFDSANVYGLAECSLGDWVEKRGLRDKLVIQTKGAHHDRWHIRVTPYDILSDVHTSLARMKTDYIDIYLLHRDDETKPVGPIVETLNALVDEGKIKAFGGSNWTHKRVAEANAYAAEHGLQGFTVVSPYYGLAVQHADPFGGNCIGISGPENAEARAYYRENNIAVVPYSSIGAGFFSGRMKSSDPEGAKAVVSGSTVRGYFTEDNFQRLARVEELAAEKGYSVAQIAMAWVLHQDMDLYPIVGSSRVEGMADNVAALEIKLTKEELAYLDLESETR